MTKSKSKDGFKRWKDEIKHDLSSNNWNHYFAKASSIVKSKHSDLKMNECEKIELFPDKIIVHFIKEEDE